MIDHKGRRNPDTLSSLLREKLGLFLQMGQSQQNSTVIPSLDCVSPSSADGCFLPGFSRAGNLSLREAETFPCDPQQMSSLEVSTMVAGAAG